MPTAVEARAALEAFEARHSNRGYIPYHLRPKHQELQDALRAALRAERQPLVMTPRERVPVDPDRDYDEERYRQMTEPPLMFSDDPDR